MLKLWNQLQRPSSAKWIKNVIFTHNRILLTLKKENPVISNNMDELVNNTLSTSAINE